MPLFLLLFVGVPLIELYLLIQVGSEIGALSTIALSVFTAILGSLLVRVQGFSVLLRVRTLLDHGETRAAVERLKRATGLFPEDRRLRPLPVLQPTDPGAG